MSGKPDYQAPQYQNSLNGPIPEGNWYTRQNQFQNFDDLSTKEKAISYVGGVTNKAFEVPYGKWPGGEVSWGNHRVWLEPDANTNTYGRTNFSTHGGWFEGSAGCIDLTNGMDDFAKDFRNYGKDLTIKVKYPTGGW